MAHTYLVVRHGSNGANQSMTPRMVLGTVEAKNREEGGNLARGKWTFYNNQICELIPWSRVNLSDARDAAIGDEEWAENDKYNREIMAEARTYVRDHDGAEHLA